MSRKVLIIEDNTDIRENIVEILEIEGYQLFSAESGKLGVADYLIKSIDDVALLAAIETKPFDGSKTPRYFLTIQYNYTANEATCRQN